MPRISRHKDRCRTGHQCSTTAPVNASQRTVFANGRSILVRGDRVAPHFILKRVPLVGLVCLGHKAILSGSSRRVFINGIGVGRRGDKADKGAMVGASFDVFAG